MSKQSLCGLLQLQILELQTAKKYEASWLENIGHVFRNDRGQFTSKGGGEGGIGETIQELSEELIADTVKVVNDFYGSNIEPWIPQGETPGEKLKDLSNKLKAQSQKFIESVDTPEEALQTAQDLLAVAAPVGLALLMATAPEVAIAFALGESIIWGAASGLVTFGVTVAVDKSLKEMGVNNPWIRGGINLVSALVTGQYMKAITKSVAASKFANAALFNDIIQKADKADDLIGCVKATLGKNGKALMDSIQNSQAFQSKPIRALLDGLDAVHSKFKPPEIDPKIPEFFNLSNVGIDGNELRKHLTRSKRASLSTWGARKAHQQNIDRSIQRAIELDDLLSRSKQGEDALKQIGMTAENLVGEIDWRSHLLKTEMKHGENLDKMLSGVFKLGQNRKQKNYQDFLDSLKVKKPGGFDTYGDLSKEDWDNVNKLLRRTPNYSDPSKSPSKIRDIKLKMAAIIARELEKRTTVPVKAKFEVLGPRAFTAYLFDKDGKLNPIINTGNANRSEIFHELAHLVETGSKKTMERSIRFRDARMEGELLQDMKYLGMPGELAIKDKFIHPYIGKVYSSMGDFISTEIVSMGLENLVSARRLFNNAIRDREHFMMALSALEP